MDMLSYLFRRLFYLLPVLLGISLVTFALIKLAPGDPAEVLLRASGTEPTREAVAALRRELGLEEPVHLQYWHWLRRVLEGDLGISYRTGQPVREELLERLPATVELAGAALVCMLLLAVPVGVGAALYRYSWPDHLGRLLALIGAAMPSFWLGLLLIYLFSVRWELLPVMGRGGLEHLLLPALTLGLGMAAAYARILRAGMVEVLEQEYVRVARAKGLPERLVVGKHALKNALLPALTLLGMSLGHLLGGTVIVEMVFAWPGVGRLAVEAIFNRDYPVIQGYALMMAVIFVLLNTLVDLLYSWLDPRIRWGGENK
ncbi:MAG: nickel ABC transporter permease [Desulfurispora sp.]|uniref:nickel ABC transporter permease n=1 Tax=Desulfurispora sp. TaxID=3014275 RepID=UPI004048F810